MGDVQAPLSFFEITLEMVPILKRRLIEGFAALGAVWLLLAGCDSLKPNPSAGTSSALTGGKGPPQMAGTSGVQDQGAPTVEDSEPHAAGKKVFRSQHCAVCHPLPGMAGPAALGTMGAPRGPGGPPVGPGGIAGSGPPRPPSLAKVGADPKHSVEWLMAQIRDPKSHNSESHMPAYDDSKISHDDLKSLAEFLESLKGDEDGEQRDVESKSDGHSGVAFPASRISADPGPESQVDESFAGIETGQKRDDNGLKLELVWCPPGSS